MENCDCVYDGSWRLRLRWKFTIAFTMEIYDCVNNIEIYDGSESFSMTRYFTVFCEVNLCRVRNYEQHKI